MVLAQDFEFGSGAEERIAFAQEQFEKRGLAAAVGAEDGDMFARSDLEIEAIQGETFVALDDDVLKIEE